MHCGMSTVSKLHKKKGESSEKKARPE